ncbi:acyl-CoA dehydrogenase [Rhodococcus sp. PvR044]|uniref:acyl-CoA dehydrogenase family protein n=1 Tax=Rhodococcus TaxID=1827 RepID=UPI000BD1EEFF|nr:MULTISPECIES: acyl-CoA dehydrogenase family protein [Rhodococcus]MBP1162145.1 acyl-CoA dehydrogenase [Rhodococcus sp. PvR099]MCZ4558005.1 acyl-CoA/acyl-ACP dehydrogenase [Rhodococcus maanshanensis]PTR43153.1 acyl-CoA dehydrogenase [Rhodococcus sp. OK611]SNX91017.1 acyl-CoA dehydrogenase [Rhodococcus sp. OK270]
MPASIRIGQDEFDTEILDPTRRDSPRTGTGSAATVVDPHRPSVRSRDTAPPVGAHRGLDECVRVAAVWADEVDREGRFPAESVAALRSAGLFGAAVPTDLGGAGLSLTRLAAITRALGRSCGSSAMIFAMHQTQVLSVVRHGRSASMRALLAAIAEHQLLLTSATTEIDVRGGVRSSGCAVEHRGDRVRLAKTAPVISYGGYADVVLVTARRTPAGAPNDQVLLACPRSEMRLTPVGTWHTIGFRGTRSPGFRLAVDTGSGALLDDPYAEISAQTMLPASHVLWSAACLGIADAALLRARQSVQTARRRSAGPAPLGSIRLAELVIAHQQLVDTVFGAAARFESLAKNPAAMSTVGVLLEFSAVKASASTLLIDLVGRALTICGLTGSLPGHEPAMSRHLRDAYGTAVMISNDRILNHDSQLALMRLGH